MKITKKLLAVVLIAVQLLSTNAFSQSTTNISGCNGYAIVFGNGIMNDEQNMQDSLDRLIETFGENYNGQSVTYKLAKNPSDGLLSDLIRVIDQKISEDSSIGWEVAFKVWFGSTIGLIPLTAYNLLQSWFKQFREEVIPQQVADLRKKYEEQYDFVDSRVDDHVAMFKQLIKTDKRKVLLVAHSQGNLYANASYRRVYLDPEIKTRSFALVGVASPANFVGGSGSYMTSGNDLVISTLRSSVNSDTLPANIDIPFTSDDVQGHGFLPVYASEAYPGLAKLNEMGIAQLNSLEDPDKDDDLDSYQWFYAKDYYEGASSGPASSYDRNVQAVAGCFDEYTDDCLEGFNHRRDFLSEAEVTMYPQAYCGRYCDQPADAAFDYGGGKTILMPGEQPPYNRLGDHSWLVSGSSARAALDNMVLPRVFDTANPAYVGFPKRDAKVRYLVRDIYATHMAWYPLYEPGPVEWTLVTKRHALAGVKNCKAS